MWNSLSNNITHHLLNRQCISQSVNYDFAVQRIKRGFEASSGTQFSSVFWESPIFATQFCPLRGHAKTLAAANEEGHVMMWNVKRGMCKSDTVTVAPCHENAIFDLSWCHKDPKFITVSGDKSVSIWDCGSSLVQGSRVLRRHLYTVKSCTWNPESAHVLASGDRGGTVILWDIRTGTAENIITGTHSRELCAKFNRSITKGVTVTGLAFFQDNFLLTAGAGDLFVHMWDMRKYYSINRKKLQPLNKFKNESYESMTAGYSHLLMDNTRNKLYATSVGDKIFSFSMNTSSVTTGAVYVGGVIRSFYSKAALSADGNYLISGSSSEFALIWNTGERGVKEVTPLRKLRTQGLEVNAVEWCKSPDDLFKIVTFAECEPVEVWDINPESVSCERWENYSSDPEEYNKIVMKRIEYVKPEIDCHNSLTVFSNGKQGVPDLDTDRNAKKRTFRELLEKDTEGMQIKIGYHAENSRRLVYGSSTSNINDKSVSSHFPNTSAFHSIENKMVPDEDKEMNLGQNSDIEPCLNVPFSPTSNLPNHVLDGSSPSHVCQPHKKRRLDWLTALRQEKANGVQNNTTNKSGMDSSTKKNETMKKLNNNKKDGNIRKFFSVLEKSTDKQF